MSFDETENDAEVSIETYIDKYGIITCNIVGKHNRESY
jgi:hypothetical protein